MRLTAALVGTAMAVLVAGCGNDRGHAEEPPLATAPVAAAPTTIPGDLALPDEDRGTVVPVSHHRLFFYVCLDPPADLVDTRPTDRRQIFVYNENKPSETQALVLYRDSAQAAEALADFRAEVARCGHGVDHVGHPMSWTVMEAAAQRPDNTFHVVADLELGRLFTTFVRRGNAVYVVERNGDGVEEVTATDAESEVAPFVTELCVFDEDACS